MIFRVQEQPRVTKIFRKLDKNTLEQIGKKLDEVVLNPYHYKNLRAPLNHLRRVHIDKSFVLVFSIDAASCTVVLEDYDHHDRIYK